MAAHTYRFSIAFLILALIPPAFCQSKTKPPAADLVVYGATAAGVMTAYAAAREGLHVVLLEPGSHLGGMVTGGLSATDVGNFTIIGGYARQFYKQAAAHYGAHDLDTHYHWLSEPHVDAAIFKQMLNQAGVTVDMHERLREHQGVEIRNGRLIALITQDGKRWPAKVFADCSYEGDLMAEAGVPYTVGRESTKVYGDSLAGVRAYTPKHQFLWPVSAYDDHHRLLPEINPGPLAAPGSGDKKVQAYNFRVILTTDPKDMLPLPKPVGYDPSKFALLERYLKGFEAHTGRSPMVRDVTNPVLIPNHKADFNNNGPFSTDYIGHSWTYPNASYAERARLWKQHMLYTQSFFYFISHDPSVPKSLRDDINKWGLPKDEFTDTGHWPNQLYIREARRMIGEYVIRQQDLQSDRTKPDSIAMGSYNSDSHNVQRVAMPDGTVQNEGDVEVPVQPYEIPYRVMLPKANVAKNLLVPVCLSASHVAYSSLRMEPQYMMIGQAAGVAASLAVHDKVAVQNVPIAALQKELRSEGAILHFDERAKLPNKQ